MLPLTVCLQILVEMKKCDAAVDSGPSLCSQTLAWVNIGKANLPRTHDLLWWRVTATNKMAENLRTTIVTNFMCIYNWNIFPDVANKIFHCISKYDFVNIIRYANILGHLVNLWILSEWILLDMLWTESFIIVSRSQDSKTKSRLHFKINTGQVDSPHSSGPQWWRNIWLCRSYTIIVFECL